jgi:hypothetical protein
MQGRSVIDIRSAKTDSKVAISKWENVVQEYSRQRQSAGVR